MGNSGDELEQPDVFTAVLSGNVSTVAGCLAKGCNIDLAGPDGLPPVCIAIRNGEIEVACFLISRCRLVQRERPPIVRSRVMSYLKLVTTGSNDESNSNKTIDFIVSAAGFEFTRRVLDYLLPRFDAAIVSFFGLKNTLVYSIIRTQAFNAYMSSILRLCTRPNLTRSVSSISSHPGTNLTAQGSVAFERMLRYGGSIEAIALELLMTGLVFNDINDVAGPAVAMWTWAARHGHLKVLTVLQAMGMCVDISSGMALHIACQELNVHLVEYLLHSGASVNIRVDAEDPPIVTCAEGLSWAMSSRHTERQQADTLLIMSSLISHGEDINQKGQASQTTLGVLCSRARSLPLIAFCLEHGADPNTIDDAGGTCLHHVAKVIHAPSLTVPLLAAGASAHALNSEGQAPMNIAARDGRSLENLELLVNAHRPAQLDWDKMLYQAMKFGSPDMVEYLLLNGANPNTDFGEDCALFRAMERNVEVEEVIKLLFRHGARANFATRSGRTALHCMASYGIAKYCCNLVPLFVCHGADLEALHEYEYEYKNSKGTMLLTPLWEACARNGFEILSEVVSMLVSAGAEKYIESGHGTFVSCTGKSGRKALRSGEIAEKYKLRTGS